MTDEWEELCENGSALIKEANMTKDDIDEILKVIDNLSFEQLDEVIKNVNEEYSSL